MSPLAKLAAVLYIIGSTTSVVLASSNTATTDSGSFLKLQQKLSPNPGDILESLDEYDKLWIEVKKGGCVWSECSMGYTNTGDDDAYGDNRDGDENWYQYRTQTFCANSAYSLYGRKRSDYHPLGFVGCTRRHFINSFFTYGGADNLLKSIGKTPLLYYDEGDYYVENNDNGNNNNDDGGSSYVEPSNADCVPYYGAEVSGVEDDADAYNNDNERQLSSNDNNNNNNNGYSSSLGCSSDGKYVMAAFKGGSCDGNYFTHSIDNFGGYNRQHRRVGCHSLWNQGASEVTYELMTELLSNSWSCDVQLYPNSCPDPFGVKGHYEYALRTAARGGNPMRAYRNSVMRKPIHALSWVLLVITVIVLLVTYNIKNHKRIMARGGGWKAGLKCLREDAKAGAITYWAHAREKAARWNAERRLAAQKRRAERLRRAESMSSRRSERSGGDGQGTTISLRSSGGRSRDTRNSRRSSRKSKSRSKSRGGSEYNIDTDDGEDNGGVELGQVRQKKSRKSRSGRRSKARSGSGGDGVEGSNRSRSRTKDRDEGGARI